MKQGEKCVKIEYEPLRQSDDKVMSKMRCVRSSDLGSAKPKGKVDEM